MIVHVSYVYHAEVRYRRKRNTVQRRYVGTVPVEVREVTSLEAPVALRFDHPDSSWGETPSVCEQRWMDGRLLEPWGVDWRDAADRRTHGEDLVRLTGPDNLAHSDGQDGNPFDVPCWWHPDGPTTPEADPGLVSYSSEDRGVTEHKVRLKADEFVLVDGVLHKTGVEPVIVPLHGGRRGTWSLKVSFPGRHNVGTHQTYRLDELGIAARQCRLEDTPDTVDNLEILIPEAVTRPAPEQALTEASGLVVSRLKGEIAERDVAFFETFMRIRDAHAVAVSGDGSHHDELVEVVRATLDADVGIDGFYRQRCEDALERLDERALAHVATMGI